MSNATPLVVSPPEKRESVSDGSFVSTDGLHTSCIFTYFPESQLTVDTCSPLEILIKRAVECV